MKSSQVFKNRTFRHEEKSDSPVDILEKECKYINKYQNPGKSSHKAQKIVLIKEKISFLKNRKTDGLREHFFLTKTMGCGISLKREKDKLTNTTLQKYIRNYKLNHLRRENMCYLRNRYRIGIGINIIEDNGLNNDVNDQKNVITEDSRDTNVKNMSKTLNLDSLGYLSYKNPLNITSSLPSFVNFTINNPDTIDNIAISTDHPSFKDNYLYHHHTSFDNLSNITSDRTNTNQFNNSTFIHSYSSSPAFATQTTLMSNGFISNLVQNTSLTSVQTSPTPPFFPSHYSSSKRYNRNGFDIGYSVVGGGGIRNANSDTKAVSEDGMNDVDTSLDNTVNNSPVSSTRSNNLIETLYQQSSPSTSLPLQDNHMSNTPLSPSLSSPSTSTSPTSILYKQRRPDLVGVKPSSSSLYPSPFTSASIPSRRTSTCLNESAMFISTPPSTQSSTPTTTPTIVSPTTGTKRNSRFFSDAIPNPAIPNHLQDLVKNTDLGEYKIREACPRVDQVDHYSELRGLRDRVDYEGGERDLTGNNKISVIGDGLIVTTRKSILEPKETGPKGYNTVPMNDGQSSSISTRSSNNMNTRRIQSALMVENVDDVDNETLIEIFNETGKRSVMMTDRNNNIWHVFIKADGKIEKFKINVIDNTNDQSYEDPRKNHNFGKNEKSNLNDGKEGRLAVARNIQQYQVQTSRANKLREKQLNTTLTESPTRSPSPAHLFEDESLTDTFGSVVNGVFVSGFNRTKMLHNQRHSSTPNINESGTDNNTAMKNDINANPSHVNTALPWNHNLIRLQSEEVKRLKNLQKQQLQILQQQQNQEIYLLEQKKKQILEQKQLKLLEEERQSLENFKTLNIKEPNTRTIQTIQTDAIPPTSLQTNNLKKDLQHEKLLGTDGIIGYEIKNDDVKHEYH